MSKNLSKIIKDSEFIEIKKGKHLCSIECVDNVNMIFNTDVGQQYLNIKKGFEIDFIKRLPEFGFSTIANILASIKLAKYMHLGKDDAIITVATDGADLYLSELNKTKQDFKGIFDEVSCAEIFGQYLKGVTTDHTLELNQKDKERIFNLVYYTWVEQQGVDVPAFEVRREQSFWDGLMSKVPQWDAMIDDFNSNL